MRSHITEADLNIIASTAKNISQNTVSSFRRNLKGEKIPLQISIAIIDKIRKRANYFLQR